MTTSGEPDDSGVDPRTQLFRAIAGLPTRLREVTRLILVERRSEQDVAEMLDLDPEEVGRRLQEGRDLLLDEIDLEDLRRRLR